MDDSLRQIDDIADDVEEVINPYDRDDNSDVEDVETSSSTDTKRQKVFKFLYGKMKTDIEGKLSYR